MRERVLEMYSGLLEHGSDRGSNDENFFSIGLPKFIFQSQGLTAFLKP